MSGIRVIPDTSALFVSFVLASHKDLCRVPGFEKNGFALIKPGIICKLVSLFIDFAEKN